MKVRCKVCKSYLEKDEIQYRLNIGNICSAECMKDFQKKEVKKKAASVPADIPPQTRARVYVRDKRRCRGCGENRNLNVHHIHYRSEGVDHSEDNLITLCVFGNDCHGKVHSNKDKYQPLLLELVELGKAGRFLSLIQLERLKNAELFRSDEGST